ncbi:MAG: AAA family ATPase [Alkalispirochaeta sp.]
MIPIRLTLQGLYSYRRRVEIDFAPLTAARLFGIFGAVGSGKSTILEAIGLALYGDTVRLNRNDNRGYNMMNLRSDRLAVDFRFLARDGHTYRFTADARRKGSDFESVGSIKRNAYRLEKEEWVPLATPSGEEVIGLSYENFRRAVIIPQGRFQEFLQLGVSDRTKMLKELFGLDRFDLFRPTQRLLRQTEERLTEIDAVLRELPDQLDLEIKDRRSSLEGLAKKRTELVTLRTETKARRDRLAETAGLLREREALQERRAELTGRERAIESDRRRLTMVEAFLRSVAVPYRAALAAEHEAAEAKSRYTIAVEDLKPVVETLNHAEEEQHRLEEQMNGVPALLAQREQLLAAITVEEAKRERDLLAGSVVEKRDRRDHLKERVESLRADEDQLTAEINKLKRTLPSRDVLRRVEEVRHLLDEERTIVAEEDRLFDELRSAAEAVGVSFDETIPDTLEGTIEALEQTIRDRERERSLERRLTDLVPLLVAGEACPLCGSVHHPSPYIPDGSHDDDDEALRCGRETLQRVGPAYRHGRRRRDEIRNRIVQLADAVDTTIDLEALAGTIDRLWETEGRVGELETRRSAVADERERLTAEGSTLSESLAGIDGRIDEMERRIETLSAGLSQDTDTGANDVGAMRTAIAEIDRTTETLTKRFDDGTRRLQSLRSEADRGRALESERRETLARAIAASDTASAALQTALKTAGIGVDADLETLEMESRTIETVRLRIETFDRDLDEVERKTRDLEERLANAPPVDTDQPIDDALAKVTGELSRIEGEISDLDNRSGEEKSRLHHLEAQRRRRNALLEERTERAARKTNLETLKRLFTGNRFVTYVAQVYLEQLTAIANDRFRRLTKNRLELVLRDGVDFGIIDYLNGGRRRSIKTLSGGQTFQAALCLALALVDSLDHTAGGDQPGFFFLDEGFGSLDQEALQDVFATLTDLRRENRIVGVISHVESLQQEIDTYLRVIPDADEGSTIVAGYH